MNKIFASLFLGINPSYSISNLNYVVINKLNLKYRYTLYTPHT